MNRRKKKRFWFILSLAVSLALPVGCGRENPPLDKGRESSSPQDSFPTAAQATPLPEANYEQWNGKRLVCLGDSITAMNGYQIFVRGILKLSNIRSDAISGTTIATKDANSFCQRFLNFKDLNKANGVFVFGGTNDYHIGVPLGTIQDEPGPDTFYGALKMICEGFRENYPDLPVAFATPLQRTELPAQWNDGVNGAGCTLADYCQAIRDVCALYQYHVIDLYNTSGITVENQADYLMDRLHPNQAGFELIAPVIAEGIAQMRPME